MSNMSYCRFENTVRDFDECAGVIEGLLTGNFDGLDGVDLPINQSEIDNAKRLTASALELILMLADEAGIDCGELDTPAAERLLLEAIDAGHAEAYAALQSGVADGEESNDAVEMTIAPPTPEDFSGWPLIDGGKS